MSRNVRVDAEERFAVMTFSQIGAALGTTSQAASNTYRRAVKKLRAMPAQLANMRGLADEMEKKRPVAVDWFGADDEEQTA